MSPELGRAVAAAVSAMTAWIEAERRCERGGLPIETVERAMRHAASCRDRLLAAVRHEAEARCDGRSAREAA